MSRKAVVIPKNAKEASEGGFPYTRVPATELRDNGAEIVSRVAYGDEPVVLTRFGKPLAAVVSLRLLELIVGLEDKLDVDAARAARRDAAKHGTVSHAELKARLGL